MTIDENDPRPRYQQLVELLRALVKRGELKPGQRIESARDMAKRYGVSLMTTQKAIDILKSEGVLVGHVGRGTFVARDDAKPSSEPSAEYQAIMNQLDEVVSRMGEIEQRIDQLEGMTRSDKQD